MTLFVGIGLEIIIRVFAFLLQTVFICLFEEGVSLFQLRVLIIIWVTSLLKMMSISMSPFYLFPIVAILVHPLCNLLDEDMRKRALIEEEKR